MVTSKTLELFPRELAHRASDGIEVTLLWSKRANRVTLAVSDSRTGDEFQLAVAPERALDAFEHPFAYAASESVDYRTGIRRVDEPVYA